MYLSSEQIANSLQHLAKINPFFGMSFLAFKEEQIPIGTTMPVNFTRIANAVLERHYRVTQAYQGFYNPFLTARKADRWLVPRYGSTSLQRITTDTFADVFLHQKKVSEWGWQPDYVEKLIEHLHELKIPAFHLAVWLFRNEKWPEQVKPSDIIDTLFKKYHINVNESAMFDTQEHRPVQHWLSDHPVSEKDLLNIIGRPRTFEPEEGAALIVLELNQIGPATPFRYEPAQRLNIITGDNSLGKTFLLDSIWWALTGGWIGYPAIPRKDLPKNAARISFELASDVGHSQRFSIEYNWDQQMWPTRSKRDILPGLVVYARFDGSFAVWDPARYHAHRSRNDQTGTVTLTREQVWNGVRDQTAFESERWVCNGLVRDWISWQTGGSRYEAHYHAFSACLKNLSPSSEENLVAGEPTRIPEDARDIPTLRFLYGDVPILTVSAGIQRIVGLAYILVWAWQEHLSLCQMTRRNPQRRLVLIIDEVEAHLHPKWQRILIPALLHTVTELAAVLSPQLHIATHSPMVMASVETAFDTSRDSLFHLRPQGVQVILDDLPFAKRGTADQWLMSEVFGLNQARSVQAEAAIARANALQSEAHPNPKEVEEAHRQLLQHLSENDDFWPRWLFFAEKHGINIRP